MSKKLKFLAMVLTCILLSINQLWGTLTADSVASSKTTSLVSGGKYVIRAGSTQTKYLAAKDGTWGTSVAIGSAYVFTVQGGNSGFIATCEDGTLTPATSNFSAYGSATSANLKLTNDGYIQNKSSTSYYLQANGSSSYKFRWYNSNQTKALMYQVGYNIHFTQPGSGSIAATSSAGTFDSDNNIMAGMYATKTATLTATPPSGKAVNAWTVKKKSDNSDVTAAVLSGTTLTMPAYDVVVSVTWKDAAPAYTITAVSNNNSYGTVSLTGNVITASPVSGYRVSTTTAYDVTAGTATVTDNGDNTFTVTPSSNCTVRINFEAIPKYTVTLEDDGTELEQASAGAAVTLPSRTGCTGYTFAGWTKSWTAPQTSWTTTAPTIIPAGSYTPTADENLYPVYRKTEGGSATYTLVSDAASFTDGTYVVAGLASSTYYFMDGTGTSDGLGVETTGLASSNVTDGSFAASSLPSGAIEIDVEDDGEPDGDNHYYFISYTSGGDTYYMDDSGTKQSLTWTTNTTVYTYHPNFTQNAGTDGCVLLSGSGAKVSQNGSTKASFIRNYASSGNFYNDMYFFKKSGGSTTYYISVPACCTDWSTPTVIYSSSLAIGGTANVEIGSGTTHGALTYESSNEDILTVESDGTITAVGAGTAHIIATWAGDATYCEKSANSNDITVSGIEITGTLPVNFGQVYQDAVIGDKTISVTGLGLTNAITPSLPSGSPFSFSPNSFAANADHATLTISANTATIGEYSHTLTLTSGTFTATATINMNVVAMPSCTFVDGLHNLTEDNNHVALSSYDLEAVAGTAVVFPVLADQSKSSGTCEGEYYKFVGWTTSDNNTDPQNHLVTSHTLAIGDNITYHAVWADATGSATYTKLTSTSFSGSPAKYVLGGENSGTQYFLHSYSGTDADVSWGECSSSETPIQFTLSGTAAALVAQDASGNYLAESDAKKKFRMNSSSATVELKDDGTIETEYFYLRYNHNNGLGGLRFYDSESSEPAYFYLVGAAGTVHYRTSCCANKVDAPVVSVTKTSTTITLTWPDDAKATGWEVEWNGAGGWVAPTSTRTYAKTGLTPNTSYTWRVRATYGDPQCGADIASGSTTTDQVYHVTYAKGDESANCTATGSTTDAVAHEAGAIVTLQGNEFQLSGYTFNAWTTDDPDVTISNNQITMPDHDVVITATWRAKVDKYFDRMHDQTDALHGGIVETSGDNEGKYYIPKSGCSYSVPTAVDSNTGDACQTSHYKLQGWIAQSYVNANGEITDTSKIFSPTSRPTWTASGATYYAVWAEVTE